MRRGPLFRAGAVGYHKPSARPTLAVPDPAVVQQSRAIDADIGAWPQTEAVSFAPKGRNTIAQGNALGKDAARGFASPERAR